MEIKYGGCFKIADDTMYITMNGQETRITRYDILESRYDRIRNSRQFVLNFILQHFEFVVKIYKIFSDILRMARNVDIPDHIYLIYRF